MTETQHFGSRLAYAQLPPPSRRYRVFFPHSGMALGNVTLGRALWECLRAVMRGHVCPTIDHPDWASRPGRR